MASKFAGAIRRQWFAPTILALDIILGVLAGGISPLAFVILPPLLLGPMIFLTGAGLLFSLRFQRAITASVVNLILGVSLWVGSFFVIGLFDLVVGNWSLSRSLYQVSYTINPVAMIGSAVEGLTDRYGTLGRSIELNFDLSADSLGPAGFLAISWLVGGAYAGIGIGMLALASRRFRRWSGRSS